MKDFTIGGVIGRTFALIRRHFGDFAVAAAILVFLPNLVSTATGTSTTRTSDAAGALRDTTTSWSSLGGGGSVLVWLGGIVLYGIVVWAALGDLRGERFGLGAAVKVSFRAFLPNLGVGILYLIGVSLGFLLLVVPGAMLQCAWLVAIPANMAEGTGVLGAFGRSRALTAGHRWPLFGLLLLYAVATIGLGLVAIVGTSLSLAGGGFWIFKILVAASSAVISLVGSAGAVACYLELRQIEGGALSSDLVESFS